MLRLARLGLLVPSVLLSVSALAFAGIGCGGSTRADATQGSDEGALHYEDTVATCRLSMTFEDLDHPPRKLPHTMGVNVAIKWADVHLDTLSAEGWDCKPIEEDGASLAARAHCGGSTICRRNGDEAMIVPDGVPCDFRPDLKKIRLHELAYLYRREITFDGDPSPGPGEQALRDALKKVIENPREVLLGGYNQPIRIGPNARSLMNPGWWTDLSLDATTTNQLVREWGGVVPNNAELPAFPKLRLDALAPQYRCSQAHLPSDVADGASFHLCGCVER